MTETKWVLRKDNKIDDETLSKLSDEFCRELEISPVFAQILINRGFRSVTQCRQFMSPSLSDSYDPFLLPDMKKAVKRIVDAKEKSQRIILYGDYDVDGTTGVSILYLFLKEIGCNVGYYIPNRLKTGYGLHLDPLNDLIDQGMELLITVDNGISALKEIEYLSQANIDVIVTDHHECQDQLPKALAVIDPKRGDCQYPFKELCGAGVSFKLIQALSQELKLSSDYRQYIECVAVATVADLVPLKSENRLLVSKGMEYLNQGPTNLGLKKLIEVSELNEIKAWHFGFVLGPKINAAGRLGEAQKIVELLTTRDEKKALELARFLSDENKKRQDLEKDILNKALAQIEERKLYEKDLILVYGQGWHSGVIGIVASRIQEKYYRPVIVIGIEDGVGKGSCRSVEGFNIFKALSASKELFLSFGGHDQAAGLSMAEDNIEILVKQLESYGKEMDLKSLLVQKLYYDARLKSSDFNWQYISELAMIEPCGIGNPGVNFRIDGSQMIKFGKMGKDKSHLWIDFDGIRAVGFNMAYYDQVLGQVNNFSQLEFIVKLSVNEFRGIESLQLQLKDIKKNPLKDLNETKTLTDYLKMTELEKLDGKDFEGLLNRLDQTDLEMSLEEQRMIYRILKKFDGGGWIDWQVLANLNYSYFKLRICIEVFSESGLIKFAEENQQFKIVFIQTNEKKDIQKSNLMIKLKKIIEIRGE